MAQSPARNGAGVPRVEQKTAPFASQDLAFSKRCRFTASSAMNFPLIIDQTWQIL
jgi:hypothetical protein